ncbi:MAG: nucleotidyltransferase domain-containing protein [Oligoflexia bacterium]|nr:nucleotidyltransferase domain-containing protein [Oligoflexia bacterium]
MDIGEIKLKSLELRKLLKRNNIRPDMIILFGSHANGTAREDSDIDVAIVSRDLGKNRFKEGSFLNLLASQIDPIMEVIPIGLKQYLDNENISPILYEVKNKGIVLF